MISYDIQIWMKTSKSSEVLLRSEQRWRSGNPGPWRLYGRQYGGDQIFLQFFFFQKLVCLGQETIISIQVTDISQIYIMIIIEIAGFITLER